MCLNDQGLRIEQLISPTRSYPRREQIAPTRIYTHVVGLQQVLSLPPLSSSYIRGTSSSSQSSNRQTQGKLVFGSNANRNPDKQKEAVEEEPQKKEEPKFQAFRGKKYSLRG